MVAATDISVYDKNGHLILAVEVKRKLNASVEWATRFRRNILVHGLLPDTKFFLLATPDRFFLWKDAGMDLLLREPTYVADPRAILSPYFERAGVTVDDISSYSLELIIVSWLSILTFSSETMAHETMAHEIMTYTNGSSPWLMESGLINAVAGGHLGGEVFA